MDQEGTGGVSTLSCSFPLPWGRGAGRRTSPMACERSPEGTHRPARPRMRRRLRLQAPGTGQAASARSAGSLAPWAAGVRELAPHCFLLVQALRVVFEVGNCLMRGK